MKIVVMKFGGTSVSDVKKINHVASIVKKNIKQNKLVIVLSAMAGATNHLQKLIDEVNYPSSVENDLVITSGEQITIGLLSILNIEIGISIIAALLTIVGYSLNDTIVVYDRIRENIAKLISDQKRAIINRSLNETLNRTVITSFTTLLVVIVLFVYGGAVLQSFALTLIIGVLIGTYTSIYVASPIMFYFEEKYPIPEFIDEEA